MVNQKGEFPLDAKISARVKSSTKRLLKKLKQSGHAESDVIEFAAKQLAEEPVLLEWEIGELEESIHYLESQLSDLKGKKQAKMNRLRCIAPKRLDEDVLHDMLVSSAKDCALEIFNSHGDNSLEMLEKRKNSVKVTGEEWGYDPIVFLDEVRTQLKLICPTVKSDS